MRKSFWPAVSSAAAGSAGTATHRSSARAIVRMAIPEVTREVPTSFAYGSSNSPEPDFRSLPMVSVAGLISRATAASEPAVTV